MFNIAVTSGEFTPNETFASIIDLGPSAGESKRRASNNL